MSEQFIGGRSEKRLKHDKYKNYAQHLNDFVKYIKENGVELYSVSIQNEPDYALDWTWWTSEEWANFAANYANQIDCKVRSCKTFQYNKQYYNDILSNSKTNANIAIAIFGTHFYGTQRNQMDFPALENDPRDIWMTEVYIPNSSSDADIRLEAIEVAVNIHNDLLSAV